MQLGGKQASTAMLGEVREVEPMLECHLGRLHSHQCCVGSTALQGVISSPSQSVLPMHRAVAGAPGARGPPVAQS